MNSSGNIEINYQKARPIILTSQSHGRALLEEGLFSLFCSSYQDPEIILSQHYITFNWAKNFEKMRQNRPFSLAERPIESAPYHLLILPEARKIISRVVPEDLEPFGIRWARATKDFCESGFTIGEMADDCFVDYYVKFRNP